VKTVYIWTDGGNCGANPGPGGYAAILKVGPHEKEISGGFTRTTNNRMELYAAIAGLEALKPGQTVVVQSDSQYVVNGIAKGWAAKWKRNRWTPNPAQSKVGWKKTPNWDLWDRLLAACERHTVTFTWVRGHAGNPLNERCDRMAGKAARGLSLGHDTGYWTPDRP
jgi:ribonuclease HI